MLIIALITFCFFLVSWRLELGNRLLMQLGAAEAALAAEIALTSLLLAFLLTLFSLRSIKDLRAEVTKRKNSETLASEERKYLQAIFNATPYGVVVIDRNKTILYANRAALNSMGYESLSDLVGRICHESLCPAQADKCPILDLKMEIDRSEKILIKKDGSRIPILKSVVPFSFGGEDVLLEAFIDISEHKQAEAFIKNILESVDEAFVVVDRNFKILSANRAYCSQIKLTAEEIKNQYCYKVSHNYDRPCNEMGVDCPVLATFESGDPQMAMHIHRDGQGEALYVETKSYPLRDQSGNITAAIEIINDITEKQKLEDQLRHAQKMEAIGTLTGGVAHEFNNVITAIMGFSEFLQEGLSPDSEMRQYADYITTSAQRAARLTQSLLAYSRKQITHMEPTDLNETIKTMVGFLRTLAGSRIELKVSLAEEPLVAVADQSQIEQVMMNLSTNAMEAMQDGGVLTLSARKSILTEKLVLKQAIIPPGDYAHIEIADTGSGIPDNVLPKIFEPFFTTKDVGQGTGLGLAMVYGIIKKHEGHITAKSTPGEGTTFNLFIPLGGVEERDLKPCPTTRPPGGTETILLAEDDTPVRELMEHALKVAGYNIIATSNGREAVEAFKKHRDEIRLLVFDLSMPEMDGLEAFNIISGIDPHAQALFVSGFLPNDRRTKELSEAGHMFVLKPISPKDILAKIRNILG